MEYKKLKKGGEHFRTYKKYNVKGNKQNLPLVNASIPANERLLDSEERNLKALNKKMKFSPRTDSRKVRTIKAHQNQVYLDSHRAAYKRDKELLTKHDTGAYKFRTFMTMPSPKKQKEALWKLIKGKIKTPGA
tara:strand:+ start:558 stop:956 length:399 start_codon:yes stop_codon:yes gene_type:complete